MRNRFGKITLLWLLAMLPVLGGCNDEDDVEAIFIGKVWKMSRLVRDGSSRQFDLELTTAEREAVQQESTFTIELTSQGTGDSQISGSLTAKGILSTSEGTWSADGKNNRFGVSISRTDRAESSALGKKFLDGLRKADRYSGDVNTLNLYFTDNNETWVIGFAARK